MSKKKPTETEPVVVTEERNTAIDYLNRDIVNIKNELQTLNKLVRDGNGQPSLMQQVTILSSDVVHMQNEFRATMDDLKCTMTEQHRATLDKNKMNWQFKTAVMVALIGSMTSLAMHFFH